MCQPRFVDYSGAPPILLPFRICRLWKGIYLPVEADPEQEDDPWDWGDLELPEGQFYICDDFDFDNPRTDYDRACALAGSPAVHLIPVGPGYGLVFATELDRHCWWAEQRMLINGDQLPDLDKLNQVHWTNELLWHNDDSDFILFNAANHGAAPYQNAWFDVHLSPGDYLVQRGAYGWQDDDPALILFRFVPTTLHVHPLPTSVS